MTLVIPQPMFVLVSISMGFLDLFILIESKFDINLMIFYVCMNVFTLCLDCLDNSDCATGASCNAGVCACNVATPVLVGDSASDTSNECVECTSTDFGSCEQYDSCDTSTNVCVGMYLIRECFFLIV